MSEHEPELRKASNVMSRVAIGLALLVVGVIVGWAITAVLIPPKAAVETSSFTLVQIVKGEVGSSINLNTVAEWKLVPAGNNAAVGTVTSVKAKQGAEAEAGDVLYTVDLRPTVIAKGSIPSFRDLSRNMTGRDVQQVQHLLATLGLYQGPFDGRFGFATESAVKIWQTSAGIKADGVVRASDVMFVRHLPARIALDQTKLAVGSRLTGGEPVLQSLPSAPAFYLPVTDAQAALIAPGTEVLVTAPDGTSWHALAGDQSPDPESTGVVNITLQSDSKEPICASSCDSISPESPSYLKSQVITVASTKGLVVPAAALVSAANGQVQVVDRGGKPHTVTVVQSARGMTAIEGQGLNGLQIRVPAESN